MFKAIRLELYRLKYWDTIQELIDMHYCKQYNKEWKK